ncbi:MAG: hypothetical protein PVH91_00800 [Pseudomonadales bacterium]
MNTAAEIRPADVATEIRAKDFWRSAGATPAEKEWYHFCIFTDGIELIVNLAMVWLDDGAVPVCTVIARDPYGWTGGLSISRASRRSTRVGRVEFMADDAELTFDGGLYHLSGASPDGEIEFDLKLTPQTWPVVAATPRLGQSGGERMHWAVVPRLAASGGIRINGSQQVVEHALAYHDHNWGRFSWDNGCSWNWGVFLPWSADVAIVHAEVCSADLSRVHFREIYLWQNGRPCVVRNARQMNLSCTGRLPEPELTVPGVFRLIDPSMPWPLPNAIVIDSDPGGKPVRLKVDLRSCARIVAPAGPDGTVTFTEAVGRGMLRLDDEGALRGPAMWEFNRVRI